MSMSPSKLTTLACSLALTASALATAPARAQGQAQPPAQAEAPAEQPAEQPAEEGPPALPPPVEEAPTPETAAPTEEPADAAPDAPGSALAPDELAQLKAQLKEELAAELKQQLDSDMEAAARDAAAQRAAALEWEEERWVEEVKPTLNFLEFDGYFRTRVDYFNRLDLGTYDPIIGRGTSSVAPPTNYRPFDGEDCIVPEGQEFGDNPAFPGQPCRAEAEDSQSLFSGNMRLRVHPTFHISEDIRVISTVDVFDNVVLGSTPESKPGFANNPTLPLPLFASNALPIQAGFNSVWNAVRVKRLWGEVMTPFGLLRIGRQPQNFGLGLLVNDGNDIDDDFGDSADQILFATRIAGHIIAPAYSFSSVGPIGRGGGMGLGGDLGLLFYPGEQGQRYNLDPSDDVHTFVLSVAKVDKEEDREARVRSGDFVLNYGAFGVYRTQRFDIPSYYADTNPTSNPATNLDQYVVRNANAGIGSVWARFEWNKLKIEAEAVGIVGMIEGTATSSNGLNAVNNALRTFDEDDPDLFVDQPLWVLQGGVALESSYAFLNDSLVVGLDAGLASGDEAPGFGLRSVVVQNPRLGDADGQQYGACLEYHERGPGTADDQCASVDNYITNFKFDPDYQVDLILFREVLGTVTDAVYAKPHVTYYVTESFGVRGDLIYANALYESTPPGLQSPLGVEGDATVFYGSDDGFYVMLQGGVLFPLAGLSHARDPDNAEIGRLVGGQRVDARFLNAEFAYTLQALAGIQF